MQLPKVKAGNAVLEYSEKVKNLGVVFDQHLTWKNRICQITQKVVGVLKNLEKFRDATPEKIRLSLVKTLILPHFDYCELALANINNSQIERLQIIQNYAIRYIYNVKIGQRLSNFYKKAEILKIEDRRKLSVLTQTHNILYRKCPNYLFDFVTPLYNYNFAGKTRAHKMTLRAPFVGTDVPERCFKVLSYRLWNQLDPELCLNANVGAFKSAMKKKIIQSY
jgi:hypothetical protein